MRDKPLDSKLNAAVKETGAETRRAVICEIVGQTLGAAAKRARIVEIRPLAAC